MADRLLWSGRIAKAHGPAGRGRRSTCLSLRAGGAAGARRRPLDTATPGRSTRRALVPPPPGQVAGRVRRRRHPGGRRGAPRAPSCAAEPLDDPDALWVHELVGAAVRRAPTAPSGAPSSRCSPNPASDLLELDGGALVPVTFVVGWEGDGDDRHLVIDPPEGLFDLGLRVARPWTSTSSAGPARSGRTPAPTTGPARRTRRRSSTTCCAARPASTVVLDVGCGTGKAARLFAERGCRVLGVEPDARMAEVARGHGLRRRGRRRSSPGTRAGRTFDLVVSAQAWHWVDQRGRLPGRRRGPRAAAAAWRSFWNMLEHEPPRLARRCGAVYAGFPEIRAR